MSDDTDDIFALEERTRLRCSKRRSLPRLKPIPLKHLARATGQPTEVIRELLESLAAEFGRADHGLRLRTVAGGWQVHHQTRTP